MEPYLQADLTALTQGKDLGKFISAETIARINTKIFAGYKTSVELLMNNEEDDDMKNGTLAES